MNRKVIIFVAIFILLLVSIIYVNSYAQAFSQDERLQQNALIKEQDNQLYMQQQMRNCDNICQPSVTCPNYQSNHHRKKCHNKQHCHSEICQY